MTTATTNKINKEICVGTIGGKRIVVAIEFDGTELSICGEVARGEGGQIVMSFKEYDERGHYSVADIVPAAGMTTEGIRQLFDVWNRWHLNDLRHETVPADVILFLSTFGDVVPDPTADVNVGDDTSTELRRLLDRNLITVTWRYIPLSERVASERQLKWNCIVCRNGREVFATEYFAGEGHCPSYKPFGMTALDGERVAYELETGRKAEPVGDGRGFRGGAAITPDVTDFFDALYRDSDVLNQPDFESWASDLGYDSDSRSAKETYDKCMENALKLRNLFGDDGMKLLGEALA